MSEARTCSQCGAPLASDAPDGFCPTCALQGALDLGFTHAAASPVPSQPETRNPEPGTQPPLRFGDYELLGEIARGGMGVVFKARQVSLNRTVAVKMILAGQLASEEDVQRFRAEAEAAANLRHPHIVAIHEIGEQDGQHFFSMDYIEGQNLTCLVLDNPWSAARAAACVKTIAEAIHYAHERGILHRDLKPSNVLLDADGQPRITDFGLAKRLPSKSEIRNPKSEIGLTLSGQVLGSPNFMPPEQAMGKRNQIGPPSDVYGLGAILYHLLTGRPPFAGATLETTLAMVLNSDAVSPRILNPSLPRDLETICLKCLEKEPHKRYVSAQELAEELARFLRDEPIRARPVSQAEKVWRWCRKKPAMAGLAAAVVLLLVALATGSTVAAWRITSARDAESRQREHAEASVTRLEIERAESLFNGGDTPKALASLARVLRREPTNRVAGERLMSAFIHRNFCTPAAAPLGHAAAIKAWEELGYTNLDRVPIALKHRGSITSAQFSRNGQRLLTASRDRTARVWHSGTGFPLLEPLQHNAEVLSAQFSRDGRRIVTACLDKAGYLWDGTTGRRVGSALRHGAPVVSVEFSPDGERVVTASEDGTARLWSSETGLPLTAPLAHRAPLTSARFSPDGNWVATASHDDSGRIWNAHTGGPRTDWLKDNNALFFAEFSPDGRKVVTGGFSGALRVWDSTTGRVIFSREDHNEMIDSAQFSPDGLRLVSTGADNRALIWDSQRDLPPYFHLKHDDRVLMAEFSPDGRRVVTASLDKTARIWNVADGQPLTESLNHAAAVLLAHFSPDGHSLVTVSEGNVAWLWDVRPQRPFSHQFKHNDRVNAARFNQAGRHIVTASFDQTACIWDAVTGQPLTGRSAHSRFVLWADFSPDGRHAVSTSIDKTARVWDVDNGQLLFVIRHADHVRAAQFSPDGKWVATASRDATAQLWNVSDRNLVHTFEHGAAVRSARFSSDGKRLATASKDRTARIWSVDTGKQILGPIRHHDEVNSALFSADDRRVVTASSDKTARIWSAQDGRALTRPMQHDDSVGFGTFNAAGSRVATQSRNSARVWNADTGKPVTESLKHAGRVNSVQFSPDGQLVVTASQDGTARVWDADTGHSVSEPLRHESAVYYAEFSPNGRWVVTASDDRSARVWELPRAPVPIPRWLPALAEAAAGQRFDPQNESQPVPPEALFQLKQSLARSTETDHFTRCAQWFFANGSSRNLSPSSVVATPQHVERRVQEATLESLSEAVRLSPTNALAWARLARARLAGGGAGSTGELAEVGWELRQAETLHAPEGELWWSRAELHVRTGQIADAVNAFDQALRFLTDHAGLWRAKAATLERAGRMEEALELLSAGIERSIAAEHFPTNTRSELLLLRWNLRKRLDRLVEAQADWLAAYKIPTRPTNLTVNAIDLSLHYNDALDKGWQNRFTEGNNLALLPRGRAVLDGTEFDIRGIIQLTSRRLTQYDATFPAQVCGIKIERKCQHLHFLQASGWEVPHGTQIGSYVIHYTDGQQRELPIIYGEHLGNWWAMAPAEARVAKATFAWQATNAANRAVQLFRSTRANPLPDLDVDSLDYVSKMTDAAPFLIAITVE